MSKNGTDSQKLNWVELGQLAGFITEFLASIFNSSQINYWLGHKTELKKKLMEVFSVVDEFADMRVEWQKFYQDRFNWTVDFSLVVIPQMPTEGKWRLLFIPKGMTMNLAYKIVSGLFTCWKYTDDLDKAVSTNVRNTSEHYAIWVRDQVEPDQEFLGQSTKQADPDMKIGMTLLERIIFEIKYFLETGNHLDIKGVTFCSGSRYSGGYVPHAGWFGNGRFRVGWWDLDVCSSGFGVRRAV